MNQLARAVNLAEVAPLLGRRQILGPVCRGQGRCGVVVQLFDDACGDADTDTIGRNVTRDDRASAHHYVVANGHTWQDYAAVTEVNVVADGDGADDIYLGMFVSKDPDAPIVGLKMRLGRANVISDPNEIRLGTESHIDEAATVTYFDTDGPRIADGVESPSNC